MSGERVHLRAAKGITRSLSLREVRQSSLARREGDGEEASHPRGGGGGGYSRRPEQRMDEEDPI
jgi:hypothetical protein